MARVYDNYSSLIDFTRASSGTALRPISYGDELVTNGGFDSDSDWTKGTGWTISDGTSTASAATGNLQQSVSVTAGKIYFITFDIVAYTSGSINRVQLGTVVGNTLNASSVGTYSSAIVANATGSGVQLYVVPSNFSGSIDNISVREVLFDQPNGTLTLFNHPTNVPRIEYDAQGNRLGLLVEESRTNLIEYSDFSATWTSSNCTLTSSQQSPDGNTNAIIFERNSTASSYLAKAANKAASSLTYSLSVFVKKDTARYFAVRLQGLYPSRADVVFDLNSGSIATPAATVLNFSSPSAYIENIGNGWYRCILTTTSDTYTLINSLFSFNSNNVAIDGTDTAPDSSGIIFGAQLEQASFPTSYIPTSASAATRSADVASIGVSEFGYNQSEGTLFIEAAPNHAPTSDDYLIQIDNGSSTKRYAVRLDNVTATKSFVINSGATTTISNGTRLDAGESIKIAFAFSDGDQAVSIDGGSVQVGSAVALNGLTTLRIGSDDGALRYLDGHIKSIKYYPRRLTNAQLQELTS